MNTKEYLKAELDKIDENIYWEIDGYGNVEHVVKVMELYAQAVKNNPVLPLVSSSCEWCGAKKENHNGLCTECGRFPSPSNFRSHWIK